MSTKIETEHSISRADIRSLFSILHFLVVVVGLEHRSSCTIYIMMITITYTDIDIDISPAKRESKINNTKVSKIRFAHSDCGKVLLSMDTN